MGTVYAFFADGFEEIEAFTAIDTLRRGGLNVEIVSVTPDEIVVGAHDVSVLCDINFDNCDFFDAELLLLPGGMPGTNNLKAHMGLRAAVECANKQGRRIAAICAAPSILGSMGLLKGRTATCYPGFEDQLTGVSYTSQGVVTDGNITTGRGLGFALDMGLELIRLLQGPQQAQKIAAAIQYNWK